METQKRCLREEKEEKEEVVVNLCEGDDGDGGVGGDCDGDGDGDGGDDHSVGGDHDGEGDDGEGDGDDHSVRGGCDGNGDDGGNGDSQRQGKGKGKGKGKGNQNGKEKGGLRKAVRDSENELKSTRKQPPQTSLVMSSERVYSMRWYRDAGKQSWGVRCVSSNMFDMVPQVKGSEVATVNATYGSLYGLGSDAFNRFLSLFKPKRSRGASTAYVFSDITHQTIYLDTWSLCSLLGDFSLPFPLSCFFLSLSLFKLFWLLFCFI